MPYFLNDLRYEVISMNLKGNTIFWLLLDQVKNVQDDDKHIENLALKYVHVTSVSCHVVLQHVFA